MKGLKGLPNIDYGELRFPVPVWQTLAWQGLVSIDEAVRLSNEWLREKREWLEDG